jgi:hypothetical protein
MLQIRQTLSRRRNYHSKSFTCRPGVEGLEGRTLMATGFPVGLIGPLPSDGYYDPSLTVAEYSGATSATSIPSGWGPVPEGTIYSNYDAPTLNAVVNGAPSPYLLPSGTVTYTTTVGQLAMLIGTDDGITTSPETSVI